MYTVLTKCTEGDSVLYAVTDSAPDSEVEFVSAEDLKLLSIVGLQMQTPKGEPVTVDGDNLVCDVDEWEPPPEPAEPSEPEDDLYSLYNDDDDGSGEGEEGSGEDEDDDPYGMDAYGEDSEDGEGVEEEDGIYDWSDLEDDTPESSVVSKLYAMLTQEQITILRRYYLWFSQRLFTDAQKDATYGLKSKAAVIRKGQVLSQLRQGGDYRYAGFLDTGSIRAGYTCSLGHPLRFMHLAWDITVGDIETAFFGEDYNANYEDVIRSNNCIAFGIKCIGDFFEVDQECIRSLQRAQRDSLKDMALMYEIYTTQDLEKVKHSFDLLDEVLKVTDRHDMKMKMMKDAEPTVPFSVASFYHQFRDAGMIPPKSLIQEIRSCLVGWTNGRKYFSNSWTGYLRKPEPSFYDRLKVIARKKNDAVVDKLKKRNYVLEKMNYLVGFNQFLVYVYLMFTYELCGYYKYTATKDGFHDEGGYNKSSVGWQLPTLYKKSLHTHFVGADYNLTTLLSLFDLVRLCLEADEKYNSESASFKLPYFSMGNRYEEDLHQGGRYSSSNRLRSIIKGFAPTEEERNDIYKVLNFMEGIIFDNHDVVTTIVRPGALSRHSDFKPCIQGRSFDIQQMLPLFQKYMADFDALYARLLEYATNTAQADEDAYNRQKAEEERKRAEAEEQRRREEEFKRGDAKLSAIEAGVPDLPTTPKGVVDYILAVGTGGIQDSKFDFAKKVIDTLEKSGKEPTQRQFQYIQPLYEAISGEHYTGEGRAVEKVELSSRPDIKDAIDWINFAPVRAKSVAQELGVADFDKMVSILGSIVRYGKISERQMRYAEMALLIANKGKT